MKDSNRHPLGESLFNHLKKEPYECEGSGGEELVKKAFMSEFHCLLHPRPVVLITSVGKNGRPNIMSVAWITPVSKNPPLIAMSIGKTRYSHRLIEETGEFVVNIPTEDLVGQVELCGRRSGKDLDKFEISGLTAKPAKTVSAPIIEECVGHLECRVVNKFSAGDHTVFVGEVSTAYADDGMFVDGFWDTDKAKILCHAGSNAYSTLEKSFRA